MEQNNKNLEEKIFFSGYWITQSQLEGCLKMATKKVGGVYEKWARANEYHSK